jgi:hypothetical protein
MTDTGKNFSEQVDAYMKKYKKRLLDTARESVHETIELAQKPRDNGGRMPVITQFLQGSIVAAIGQIPSGKSKPAKAGDEAGKTEGSAVSVELAKWDPNRGEVFYVGWSAAYARRVEYGFKDTDKLGRKYNQEGAGFLRGAMEKWDETVDSAAKKFRKSL